MNLSYCKMKTITYTLEELSSDNPLYQKGQKHINEAIFVSALGKRKLKKYCNAWYVKNPYHIHLVIFLKPKQNIKHYHKTIPFILWRLHFMRDLAHNKKPISIWIWPTPWKKTIPLNKKLTLDHINSGSTTTYSDNSDNGEICIWRKEELLKVLVHEAIHSLRLDKDDPHPKEAYVEWKAILANNCLELLERKLPLSKMDELLKVEQEFGKTQAKKIRKCASKNTNALAYLDERNRLLSNMSRTKWDLAVKKSQLNHHLVPTHSLRFTVADLYLNKMKKPKKIFKK